MRQPRLLDLFCGAGGAGMGYHRAGFDVTGVDINPQRRYPFAFIQADALEYVREHGHEYDVIHASPPCQVYSVTKSIGSGNHPDLVPATRAALMATGKPFVIENVPGAPLLNPLMLCGTMFSLRVIRHRLFEVWPEPIWFAPYSCNHDGESTATRCMIDENGNQKRRTLSDGYEFVTVCGDGFSKQDAEIGMEIDWMAKRELAQAIPPAYTEWLGRRIMEASR